MEISPEATLELLQDVCERSPDILKSEYRWLDRSQIRLDGYCYPLAEALYHLYPGTFTAWRINWAKIQEDGEGTHWFLRYKQGGRIVETTNRGGAPVCKPEEYAAAQWQRQFRTAQPSKRCRTLIERAGLSIPVMEYA